ncbi:MAG: hypothetical protein IIB64_09210, partial [Proteobacteria bacterium]|nr:hypothetical protein [Pseudomonadota bacterium]
MRGIGGELDSVLVSAFKVIIDHRCLLDEILRCSTTNIDDTAFVRLIKNQRGLFDVADDVEREEDFADLIFRRQRNANRRIRNRRTEYRNPGFVSGGDHT